MSVEAFTWALTVPVGGNAKVVLLGLANHAHPDGTEAYPALDTLATYAHCDRSTARRNVRKLAEAGWIIEDGLGPKGQAKYRLAMAVEARGGKTPPAAAAPARGGAGDAEGVAPVPPEPSLEPSSTTPRAERARERASELPSDFPPALTEHARQAHRVLSSVAEQHNAREVTLRAVALTMQGQPRRRYVSEAHALAAWAQAPPRPIRDVVGTYRTWLSRADVCAGVEPLGAPATNGNVHAMRPRRNGQPTLSDFVALTEQLRAEELAT